MLEAYDRGAPIRQVAFPLQALRFNDDLTLLAFRYVGPGGTERAEPS